MKVKCIRSTNTFFPLINGMVYEAPKEDGDGYLIDTTGTGELIWYHKNRFEVVGDEVKEKVEEEVAEEPRFNWEEFINTKTVVNCDTEDKAKNFLEECRSRGIVWEENKTGRTCWDWYKKDTCYSFNFGGNNALTYSDKQFYESEGYKIIKWECENMKFKVGDWVVDVISNEKHKVLKYATDKQGNKGYILDCNPFIYFDFELKLCEKPQREFTFQEVIGRIKQGEIYINTYNDARAEKISMEYSKNSLHIEGCFNNGFSIDLNHKFKLQVPKKQVTIYEIEHKQGGKKYYFRSSVALNNGDFVVCDATQGKSYGRVVGGKMLELTESETNRYKECWRA